MINGFNLLTLKDGCLFWMTDKGHYPCEIDIHISFVLILQMSKIVTKSIDNKKQFKYHVCTLKECLGELVPLLRQEINVPYRPKTIRFVKK